MILQPLLFLPAGDLLPQPGLEDTGAVPEFCTCGVQLPPDARFCHKCGKPQREEVQLVEEETAPPALVEPRLPPPTVAPPPAIDFRNSLAVRVGFLAGSLAFMASSLPFPVVLRFFLLMGAGAFSVFLYRRRSGHPLEIRSGVKMGWITGLFCFVIFTVLFTISFVAMAVLTRDAGMIAVYRQQLGAMGMSPDKVQEALDLFKNPAQILLMLVSLFVTSTVIPAVGGALGARFFNKN
jgi:hypothetical protein